jgi:hypothetical protein
MPVVTKAHLFLAVPLVLLAVGCQSKEAQLEGTWKVKDVAIPSALAKGAQAEQAKTMLKAATLEFKKEKKFTLIVTGALDGDWSFADNAVSLKVATVSGKSIAEIKTLTKGNPVAAAQVAELEKPMVATLAADGKTLTLTLGPAGKQITFTFEKNKS